MALRLSPKDDAFSDLFGRVADLIVAAADELVGILGATDPDERQTVAKRIGELEKAADEATHEVIAKISASFVTALDRDDLHRLAVALDDCLDRIDDAADLMKVHSLTGFTPRSARMVDVVVRMARLTQEAMPHLRAVRELGDYCQEVARLGNHVAKNHRRLVAEALQAHSSDPLTAFRHVLLANAIRDVAAAFVALGRIIESIAVKET